MQKLVRGDADAIDSIYSKYKDDLLTNEGIDIAIRAISAAKNRDSASGGRIDIVVITKDGFKEIPEDEVKKHMEKLAK